MIGAIDIGGTKIAVGLVNESGHLLFRSDIPTAELIEPEEALATIEDMLRRAASEVGEQPQGIGVGCTGPVNPLTGVLGRNQFLPRWEGFPLADKLAQSMALPVAVENDADAAALAEWTWGTGQGASRFVYITISTGIGAGLIIDGKLYRGVGDSHPEIGHHVIDPSGPACFCGAHGCWESLASGRALASEGKRSSAQEVCQAAIEGDPIARKAVLREGKYLGLGIANLVTILTPEVVALGGGLMQSRHLFWDTIHTTIRQNCGLVPFEKTRLSPAALGANAGLLGAACVWLNYYKRGL